MNDIIAGQKIQRRPQPSLLSAAGKYRVCTEQPFIGEQHPPRRKKNPLLELKKSFSLPDGRYPRIPRPLELAAAGISKKHFFTLFGILCALGLAVMAAVNYIPDPEPPEGNMMPGYQTVLPPAAENASDEIPLDLTETFAWQHYTVKPGDAVESIAKRFGLSLDAVIASNNLRNVRQLRAGESIRIPNMDGIPYTVKNGDSYVKISKTMDVPLEAILDANDIQNDAVSAGTVLFIPGAKMDKAALREALGGNAFIWPIAGRRTSPFGWRNDPFNGLRSFHAGLDISSPQGTSVKVSADGRVSATGYNNVYGNFIIITHSEEYQTMYAHLNKIFVKTGSYVNQGAIIGQVGNTGRSTGPHLHFSVYRNKRAVNPLEVLNK